MLNLITSLPQLITIIYQAMKFILYLRDQFGDSYPKYLQDLNMTFKDLNQAKTLEEKQAVAEKLSKLASRWGIGQ